LSQQWQIAHLWHFQEYGHHRSFGLEIDFLLSSRRIRAEFAMSCCIVTSPLSRPGTTVAYFQRRFSGKRIKDVRNFLKSIRNRLPQCLGVAERIRRQAAQAQALLMTKAFVFPV
jgi:hypothetical protein